MELLEGEKRGIFNGYIEKAEWPGLWVRKCEYFTGQWLDGGLCLILYAWLCVVVVVTPRFSSF